MEARPYSAFLVVAALLSLGASHRTENFIVSAGSPQLAREVCEQAEHFRRELAIEWLGQELPAWRAPCPIHVKAAPHLGAGGATSFAFVSGYPTQWSMTIQGSRERLLDSVLPHEVTHTIFATHFGRPLPRWADEGACTTVEDISERTKQHHLLIQFLQTRRGIPFNRMFAMKEYPRDILPLYAQGYSLARYLIAQGGKQKFVQYVGDGMQWNNWTAATAKHYGFKSLSDLQQTWIDWVAKGSPRLPSQDQMLARNNDRTVRGQSPDPAAGGQANGLTEVVMPAVQRQQEPLVSTAELKASPGSWYVRQAARSRGGQAGGGDGGPAPGAQSLSRPQPMGQPGQVILEWSKSQPYPRDGYAGGVSARAPTVMR